MRFRLPYRITNNGDGSASVHFHRSIKEAEEQEALEDEPFAEDTVSTVELELRGEEPDMGLFFNCYGVWIRVEP